MRVNTPRGASNGFVGKMKEIRGKKMQSKKVNFFFFFTSKLCPNSHLENKNFHKVSKATGYLGQTRVYDVYFRYYRPHHRSFQLNTIIGAKVYILGEFLQTTFGQFVVVTDPKVSTDELICIISIY